MPELLWARNLLWVWLVDYKDQKRVSAPIVGLESVCPFGGMKRLMKLHSVIVVLVLAVGAAGQAHPTHAFVYGKVFGLDGEPERNIGVTAVPLGVALAAVLPHTKTNDAGEYRVPAPWWGRYTVCAEDEQAGYSSFATGCGGPHAPEVEITPEHPQAELNLTLPPKAGFLEIHLSNRQTGEKIPTMLVRLTSAENPDKLLYSTSRDSNKVILLSPNKDLLLHITSRGFEEWDESAGNGEPIRLTSGERVKLDVQLDPN